MFSLKKHKHSHITKSFRKQIQKAHMRFVADRVLTKTLLDKRQQCRKVYFLPIIKTDIISLSPSNSLITLHDTFLYVQSKRSKNSIDLMDFQYFKYNYPSEQFVTAFIDPVISSYGYDTKSNPVTYSKIFGNYLYRIVTHILLAKFSSSVCESQLILCNAGKHLKIIHQLEPSFKPVHVSDCISKLYGYLSMHQSSPVESLDVIKSLLISVVEVEACEDKKYPYLIKVVFEFSIGSLHPLTEHDNAQYDSSFSKVISQKLMQI